MPKRTPKQQILEKSSEISLGAPEVVARRLTQMWMAGAFPTAADRTEVTRMSEEKIAAFYDSWSAMWMQAGQSQWNWAMQCLRAVPMTPLALMTPAHAMPKAILPHMMDTALRVANAGLTPIHTQVQSNVKRLRRR